MKQKEILREFEETGAILRGHFILTSGLHSDTYMQCAKVLMHPSRAEKLCSELARKVREELGTNTIDIIVAPAMGGVVVGYEMGRQLGVPTMFCERVDGKFTLRRGFDIKPEQRALIVEDVVTTGKSSIETIECIKEYGGHVVGEACLINRNGNKNPLPIPLVYLAGLEIKTYEPQILPAELAKIPAVKPGSRNLQK